MEPNTFNSPKIFFKRFLLLLVFYQACRLGFYFYNYSFFHAWNLKILLGGLRFDLAALGYINLPFVLLHLIPHKYQDNSNYQKGLLYGFWLVNTLFICLNYIDYEYFKFIGRRSSYGMITADGMENEIIGLLQTYVIDFWQIPLFMFVTGFLLWIGLRKIKYQNVTTTFSIPSLALALLTAVGFVILGRGGFQPKPLRLVDASKYGEIGNSALVLNTPFSVLKTIGKKGKLNAVQYYSKDEADRIFNPEQHFNHEIPNKKNVVLLILESFGRENIQRGQTPFLDSLITKSYFFEYGFANGKLSMDAVPSTISSVPSLMNTSYISSSYSLNTVYALPKILKDNGYTTSFFHGAFNGSQNFDQYAVVAGFDSYYGMDQYKGPESFDGKWGVFDEDFLQYFAHEIDQFKTPFFTTLFTISSHVPFTIPEKYASKFPKGSTVIHESIAYTDYALKQYFETVKTKDWYNNTLFVITADHTSSYGEEPKWKNNVGKFRIPILFFEPGNPEMVGVHDKNFQQIDILPSLMDLLKINTRLVTFGKSYQSELDFVVNYLDNIYNFQQGDFYLAFDGEKTLGLYNWKVDPVLENNLMESDLEQKNEMERFLKAYIQSFNQRVQDNQLILAQDEFKL